MNISQSRCRFFSLTALSVILAVGLGLGSAAWGQDTVPAMKLQEPGTTVVIQPIEQETARKTRADIYDEEADATADIAAALAQAKKNNTRVLIQWGANWCGWCHLLHELCQTDREIARKLLYEYEVVLVDIGDWGKNADLAEKYKADLKSNGVPFLTVLDADGNVLVNQETGTLEGGDAAAKAKGIGHDRTKVLNFLTDHESQFLIASKVLKAGLSQAEEEGKQVFLHFGAPWCGWCHRLEDWMARPEIEAILAKAYVDVKIDQDRMIGGAEMLTKTRGTARGGIPWFAVLDAKGKKLITSDGPDGNIGFPVQDNEVAHFLTMMRTTAKNLSEEDLMVLEQSLRAKEKKSEDRH